MTFEKILGVLSAAIISTAQLIYLVNTIRRKIRPSVLSWIGWSFLMGTSVVSQVAATGWQWSMTSVLSSALGCLIIGLAALLSGNYSLARGDWRFLGLGALCVGLYLLSGNAWMTTGFAISADALLGIPTILKAVKEPELERSPAWLMGTCSASLALISCIGHSWLYVLFPAYLFCFNGLMAWLTQLRPYRAA
jgi:hypothetical protein